MQENIRQWNIDQAMKQKKKKEDLCPEMINDKPTNPHEQNELSTTIRNLVIEFYGNDSPAFTGFLARHLKDEGYTRHPPQAVMSQIDEVIEAHKVDEVMTVDIKSVSDIMEFFNQHLEKVRLAIHSAMLKKGG